MKIFVLVAVAMSVGLVLSGCSSSGGGGDSDGHVTQDGYDPAQCTTLLPTTGGSADMSKLHVYTPVTSAYFGKPYNRAMLEGILDASATQTQAFIKAKGIGVYKIVTTHSHPCLFWHELSTPPDLLQQTWDEESGGDHGGGHLDGLYVAYTDGVHQGTQEGIMVREDSSRWTLVHESMHANFNRERATENLPSATELRQEEEAHFDQLMTDYANYKTSLSPENYQRVVTGAGTVSKLLYQALVSGSLEEIADESLLLEEWSAGRLNYVSKMSAKNAAWYINYARTLSLKDLNDYADKVTEMRNYVIAFPPKTPPVANPADPAAPAVDPATAPSTNPSPITEAQIRHDFGITLGDIASVNQATAELAQKAKDRTADLVNVSMMTTAATFSTSSNAYSEMTNAHLMAMNNTPALMAFRRKMQEFEARFPSTNGAKLAR